MNGDYEGEKNGGNFSFRWMVMNIELKLNDRAIFPEC